MIKGENLCFLLNNVMPHFYFSGKHGDSCIASDVPTIFSMIVDEVFHSESAYL